MWSIICIYIYGYIRDIVNNDLPSQDGKRVISNPSMNLLGIQKCSSRRKPLYICEAKETIDHLLLKRLYRAFQYRVFRIGEIKKWCM